jgi:hypothetical protein
LASGLLELRVLGFGLLQDGDAGVCIFPQRKKVLISGAGFGGVALQDLGAGEAKMRERADGFVLHNTALVKDFAA